MPRYRITIEYDGAPFIGWQVQAEGRSVQGSLVTAIQAFCGEAVTVNGAGRTDSGVHARGQVAHFDLQRTWDPFRVREAINFHLRPDPIAVLDCELAPDTFDARFSAIKRHYLYRILPRRAPAALDRDRVWRVTQPLDITAMHTAALELVGRHDFSTFRAAACQAKSPLKTLDRLDVYQTDDEIHIAAEARSFLHKQVRSMVGCLKAVGDGKWSVSDLRRATRCRGPQHLCSSRAGVRTLPDEGRLRI